MEEAGQVDLRREPRFDVRIQAQAQVLDTEYETFICNLSQSGLQLECDHRLVVALMPNVRRPNPRESIALALSFELLLDGQEVSLGLHCRVVYSRRLAQTRYLLGCGLAGFEGQSAERLDAYLNSCGRQSTD